jgi:hypothetical protein
VKLISWDQGITIIRYSQDEVAPDNGVAYQNLLNTLSATYMFAGIPSLGPALSQPFLPVLPFQAGQLVVKSEPPIAIAHMVVAANGVAVTCKTTDLANKVVTHYIELLDSQLGFKIASSKYRTTYVSSIVVEFSKGLDQLIPFLAFVENVIADTISGAPGSYKLKRLAFGYSEQSPPVITSLDDYDKLDCVIERRVGEPLSSNRYFCSATLTSEELMKLLQKIEGAPA